MPTRATVRPRNPVRRIAPGVLAVVLAATGAGALAAEPDAGDPLEPVNRVSHRFSLFLDRAVLGPVSRAYVRVTPAFVRVALSNFLHNLTYPSVILNDFLQGKVEQGFHDSMRLVVNTTFGLGGFIDFASEIGLERHEEDLGQTLAVWGVKETAYLELPALGPSSVRDVGGVPLAWQTSLIALADLSGLAIPVAVLGAIDARANASEMIEFRDRVALDSYVFTREAYRRRRQHLIMDGEVPEDDEDLYSVTTPRHEHMMALVAKGGSMGIGRGGYDPFPR